MLVLSRKKNEQVKITVPPSDRETVIWHTVIAVRGDKVRQGYEAPPDVIIDRGEVAERKEAACPNSRER